MSWRLTGPTSPGRLVGDPPRVRLRRRVHPVAWIGPVAGSIITMVAWAGVAHSSGSGWVQAVGALLGAFLLVGLVAPVVPARRARVACTACPADARAGQPARDHLRGRPARPDPAELPGRARAPGRRRPARVTDRRRSGAPRVGGASSTPWSSRSASSAPFGLVWWARDVELPLPHLLHVAPRIGEHDRPLASMADAHGEAVPRVPSGIGEPRGIRPYTPGDPRRAVHWPATSHAGMLMVRESERPTDDPVFVELVLPDDPVAAEAEAERIMAGGRPTASPAASRWCSPPTRRRAGSYGRSPTRSTSDGGWPGRCRA